MTIVRSIWIKVIGLLIVLVWQIQGTNAAESWKTIEPGVQFFETEAPGPSGKMKLWFYLPSKRGAKVPCVFIAPAGSRLYHGMNLGAGDRPEHLPYVRAGYAVVAYSVDGPLSSDPEMIEAVTAVKKFMQVQAGVKNAQMAISTALAELPMLDPQRVYVAGHSSSATLALLVAANDKRVKGCIAYAPCVDVPGWVGSEGIKEFSLFIPSFEKFLVSNSPNTVASLIRCPLFLFHADDDSKIPTAQLTQFANNVVKGGGSVTFEKVATGGHYDSMINQGIPLAINWLKQQK